MFEACLKVCIRHQQLCFSTFSQLHATHQLSLSGNQTNKVYHYPCIRTRQRKCSVLTRSLQMTRDSAKEETKMVYNQHTSQRLSLNNRVSKLFQALLLPI